MVVPNYGLPTIAIPAGLQWRLGGSSDREQLQYYLQLAFAEAFPEQTSWAHLSHTVDRYFNPDTTPLWWIECRNPVIREDEVIPPSSSIPYQQMSNGSLRSTVACVWATRGIGQATGCSVAYIMALWVSPNYRRQGLGTAAVQAVRTWGEQIGCTAIELQVFGRNQSAHLFYRAQGFGEMGSWLQLPLHNTN